MAAPTKHFSEHGYAEGDSDRPLPMIPGLLVTAQGIVVPQALVCRLCPTLQAHHMSHTDMWPLHH